MLVDKLRVGNDAGECNSLKRWAIKQEELAVKERGARRYSANALLRTHVIALCRVNPIPVLGALKVTE